MPQLRILLLIIIKIYAANVCLLADSKLATQRKKALHLHEVLNLRGGR